jgi:threonine/homoserine/homoserine lactone efflux protein
MPTIHILVLFSGAAFVLAVMPGPGLFYVVGRTLATGREDGLASCLGTMLGGLVHVCAGAIGVSALLMESAEAFSILKIAGGLYLIFLALQSWRSASAPTADTDTPHRGGFNRAFRQAIFVEASNPKTAAFFLALIPQFIDPERGLVAYQFVIFGLISVTLNTGMDLIAVAAASFLRDRLAPKSRLVPRLRKSSAVMLGGLGVYFLLARRSA